MDQEIAKLWLNSGSLTTTPSRTGVRSADNMTVTFNFDLRLVLGETLWSKYKYFKMYINDTFPNNALGMTTLYQNGLNLIQASYQGKQAGFQTAIDETNLAIDVTNTLPRHLNRSSNRRTFVMIKPDENNVQLTLQFVDETGATTTIAQRIFFLAFVPIDDTKIYRSPYALLYQNEQVNFTLNGFLLPAGGGTNQFGTSNANRTILTFANINMRNILGTLWDKYDKFNLICNNIGFCLAGTAFTAPLRRMWFELEGLQFINNLRVTTGYKQGNGFTQQLFYVDQFTYDAEYGEPPMSINTFRKPESENIDFTIYCWCANNGGEIQPLAINRNFFTFSVVGVKE